MTPNRAEATCLICGVVALAVDSRLVPGGSSPPSPVFVPPPARCIPMVSAWWASGLSAPTLMADATKRRTIDARRLDLVERQRRGGRDRPHDLQLVARRPSGVRPIASR